METAFKQSSLPRIPGSLIRHVGVGQELPGVLNGRGCFLPASDHIYGGLFGDTHYAPTYKLHAAE